MTRSYIQKVTVVKSEDTATTTTTILTSTKSTSLISCHCDSRKMKNPSKFSSNRRYILIPIFLIGIIANVHCTHYPDAETSTVSSSYMEKFISDSQHESDYNDFDDYESLYNNDEVRKKYQDQSEKYSQKKLQNNDEHDIRELPKATTRPTPSKCTGSCFDRITRENEAIDAFKRTLLMKLGMEKLPNVTKTQKLPDDLLENLCIQNKMPVEYCTGKSANFENLEYQSDDPNSYGQDQVIEQEEDVQFMSSENRIYAFPKSDSKARHKSYLKFTFDESQENNNAVMHASLNLFLNSQKYLIGKNIHSGSDLKTIDIEVREPVDTGRYTSLFEIFRNYSIPESGDGQYVHLNITGLVDKWFHSHNTTHGVVIKVMSTADGTVLSHNFVSLNGGNYLKRPYIDIILRDQRKKRTKRSSLICPKDSAENRCCRHPLTVDFEKFGWDWIIAPKRYDANYCAGECQIAFMQKYAHTHVVQLSTAANPCCSPKKMSPMQLLYFDSNLNIILGTIPHMIVEECFCS